MLVVHSATSRCTTMTILLLPFNHQTSNNVMNNVDNADVHIFVSSWSLSFSDNWVLVAAVAAEFSGKW